MSLRVEKPIETNAQFIDYDSAPIFYWDEMGRFTPYGTEELLSQRLNGFKDWQCSAGRNSLFIHFEGIIFRGTCMAGGASGNIYDKDFDFPNSDITCPRDYCMCGGDIMVPKYKNLKYQNLNFTNARSEMAIKAPVAVTGSEGKNFSKRVIWSIGKRCNYDCSYCTPDVHNSTEAIKSRDMLLTAAEKLVTGFCKGQKTIFYIAGGEPTLYPGLADLTKYLYEQGHECVVVSNGSTKTEIYQKLIKYSHVCLSAHFEFLKEDRFIQNVKSMISILDKSKHSANPLFHRLDIKLMTKPGAFDRSIKLARKINSIFFYKNHGTIRFNPLWNPENPEKLYDYTAKEKELFINLNNQTFQNNVLKQNIFLELFNIVINTDYKTLFQNLYFLVFTRTVYNLKQFSKKLAFKTEMLWWKIFPHLSKTQGQLKKMSVQVWNAVYYNQVLRKPFYFFTYLIVNRKTVFRDYWRAARKRLIEKQ